MAFFTLTAPLLLIATVVVCVMCRNRLDKASRRSDGCASFRPSACAACLSELLVLCQIQLVLHCFACLLLCCKDRKSCELIAGCTTRSFCSLVCTLRLCKAEFFTWIVSFFDHITCLSSRPSLPTISHAQHIWHMYRRFALGQLKQICIQLAAPSRPCRVTAMPHTNTLCETWD